MILSICYQILSFTLLCREFAIVENYAILGVTFLAALWSSRSLVVGRSVRWSVRPSVMFVKK